MSKLFFPSHRPAVHRITEDRMRLGGFVVGHRAVARGYEANGTITAIERTGDRLTVTLTYDRLQRSIRSDDLFLVYECDATNIVSSWNDRKKTAYLLLTGPRA